MTAFQAYAEAPSAGQLGHLAANLNGVNAASTLVRAVDAAIACGLAQCEGATPGKTCKSPTTDALAKASIGVLLDPAYLNEIGTATTYTILQPATLIEEGYLWVNAEGTVAVGDKVCVRHTSDGGSNVTPGTLTNVSDYAAGGIVLTPVAVVGSDSNHYSLTLFDGFVRKTYSFNSDITPTVAEVITGLVTLINADTPFDAVDGTTTIAITSVTGILEIDHGAQFTAGNATRCAPVPGWTWHSARTGAGLAKIRLRKQS